MANNKKQDKSFWKTIRDGTIGGIGAGIIALTPQSEVSAEEVQKEISKPPYQTEQIKKEREYIFSKDKKLTSAGDGVLLKTFIQDLPLKTDSNINLNNLFYNQEKKESEEHSEKEINFRVIDSQKGIENIQNYILSQERLGGREKSFLDHLEDLKRHAKENPSDPESLSKLEKALADGIINVEEDSLYNSKKNKWNIKDGTYMLIAKSDSESVPILIDLSTHEKDAILEKQGVQSTLYGDNLRNLEDYGTLITFIDHDIDVPEKFRKKTPEKKNNLELIAQTNFGSNFYGIGAGVKYGPIAGILNFYNADDETVKKVKTPASPRTGRYGAGEEREVDKKGIGLGLEYHPQKFLEGSFVGVGGTHWTYDIKTDERIHSPEGDILSQNNHSRTDSDFSWQGYGGYNFNLTDNLRLGVQAGYDTEQGGFGGVRASYEFGNKK